MNSTDLKFVESAANYAVEAHEGQFRKGSGNFPYAVHPMMVATLVASFSHDPVALVAGWLHDVIEECGDSHRVKIQQQFGNSVLTVVDELTDVVGDKATRKAEQIRRTPFVSDRAKLVRICDKIANIGDMHLTDWSDERKIAYIEFCDEVVGAACFGNNDPAVLSAGMKYKTTKDAILTLMRIAYGTQTPAVVL